MKKYIIIGAVAAICMIFIAVAFYSNGNTVQTVVVSNEAYVSIDKLEAVTPPDILEAGEDVYASVHFIESPAGSRYEVKWYLDGTLINSESQKTMEDMQDILNYRLEGEKAQAGMLKVEILCGDSVLWTQESKIQ